MAIREAPCGWEPDLTRCASGPCCPDVSDPVVAQIASDLAAAILWRLTGMRFGCCEVTVRPCKPQDCDPLSLTEVIYWDTRWGGRDNLGVFNFTPTLIDGAVFNISCGCPQECCTCTSDCEVLLPGPVCSITEVKVNGVVVPPDGYSLYDHSKLVFLGGENCPPCQNYNLPAGSDGTWTVTYTIGEPLPPEANFLAGLYACELAKSFVGQDCALPRGVQAVSRRGVDVVFADPFELAKDGLTGIPIVDLWVKAVNPNRLASRSRVWSPDLPVVRRET